MNLWKPLLLIAAIMALAKKAGGPSGFDTDYRGQTGLPIGIRSNNPGNLIGGGNWQGLAGSQPGGYNIFETFGHGIRAMIITLNSYRNNHNLDTLRKITHRWAPFGHGGNDPDAYAEYLAAKTGYLPDEPLPWNADTIFRIARGITGMENGPQYTTYLTRSAFNTAYNLV